MKKILVSVALILFAAAAVAYAQTSTNQTNGSSVTGAASSTATGGTSQGGSQDISQIIGANNVSLLSGALSELSGALSNLSSRIGTANQPTDIPAIRNTLGQITQSLAGIGTNIALLTNANANVAMNGSNGTTVGGTQTPGTPNTGAGGMADENIALLMGSLIGLGIGIRYLFKH